METYDFVIIGSGAGGAPIAHRMVKAGKTVLVLEKGPMIRPQGERGLSSFKRDELWATGPEKRIQIGGVSNNGRSYYSSHVEPDLNDEPHVYRDEAGGDSATIEGYTAQVVGGGTQLYGAVSLRFSEDDFRLGSFNAGRTDVVDDPAGDIQRYARDWPISYQDLEPFYTEAERSIGINGTAVNQGKPMPFPAYQTPLPPNPISAYVETGMDALGMARYRTPLAVITEDHVPSGRTVPPGIEPGKTGYVNRYGDPLGLKSNTWVALLAPLEGQPNFEIRCNSVVTHLRERNGRVDEVHYLDPGGNARIVRGKVVVVACSAIESIRLLKISGEEQHSFAQRAESSDLLGKFFLTHCFGGAEARMPERFDKSVSLDSDWATDHCATEAFIKGNGLWAGGAIYNNTSDQALPLSLARTHGSQDLDTIWSAFEANWQMTGERLIRFFDEDFGTRLSVSFMANQVPLPSNRIELHSVVRDKWGRKSAYIIKDWHSHDRYLMRTLAEQCANILRFGGDGGRGTFPVQEFGGIYLASNYRARIANHILGGARFGSSPSDSVLDPFCRMWEFDNLYVADGAFMPTSGSANPTLTIQANSFRLAPHLEGRV